MSTTLQYLKFENYDEFQDDLSSFEGDFTVLFEPASSSKEDYCYIEIELANIKKFMSHFLVQLTIVDSNNADEWPGSWTSKNSGRNKSFTRILKPGR